MDTRATEIRLKRLAQLKFWLIPAIFSAAGALLELVFHWTPAEFVAHALEGITSLFHSAVRSKPPEILGRLVDVTSGPIAGFLVGFGVAKLKPVRQAINILPFLSDPPAFVRYDLDEEREAAGLLVGERPPHFVGRAAELDDLRHFAFSPGLPARWREVIGPGGIGKSRLAIEWLAAMGGRWDAGVVDPKAAIPTAWRARRPTALVIDEAQRDWSGRLGETILTLCAGARDRAPVRILVLGKSRPNIKFLDHANERAMVDACRWPEPLRLDTMTDEDIVQLWTDAIGNNRDERRVVTVAELKDNTAGWPRAILRWAYAEGTDSYREALKYDAIKSFPELADVRDETTEKADQDRLTLVILSILAGPVTMAVAKGLIKGPVNAHSLKPFFTTADLETTLPAFRPDDLGNEVLLRTLDLLGDNAWPVVNVAIEANADAVALTLEELWNSRQESDGASRILNGLAVDDDERVVARSKRLARLQSMFDERVPKYAEDDRKSAQALVGQLASKSSSLDSLAVLEERLLSICGRRRFDPAIQLSEATWAVDAIIAYGKAHMWGDLERWGGRIITLAETEPFKSDPAIRLTEAKGAVNAMGAYRSAQRLDDIERWGGRLITLAETEPFQNDSTIRLQEAKAAGNAIGAYGDAQLWGDLERWGGRVITLIETNPFKNDLAIRRSEAVAAINAIAAYGEAHVWDDLERWGRRLITLVETKPFGSDPTIQRHAIAGTFNAISSYSAANRWDDLERWGRQQNTRIKTVPFGSDPELWHSVSKGTYNAMRAYGKARLWDGLERWGRQLITLAETKPLTDDPAIRLHATMGTVNAIGDYGGAHRWEDLERWGLLLVTLLDAEPVRSESTFRLHMAMAAADAIGAYGGAHRWDDLERWGRMLATLVEIEPFKNDPVIRLEEAKGAFNAITAYGNAHLWDDLERWGRPLVTLAETEPFKSDPAIRLREARGAFNAIRAYDEAALTGSWLRRLWFFRLAKCARAFPSCLEIQEHAHRLNVSNIEQEAKNWPYGKPNDTWALPRPLVSDGRL